MYGTNPSLRSVMIDNGDAAKQIWATEFGAPTDGPAGSHVSEDTQAKMLSRAYSVWSKYDWAGPLFAYQGRDHGHRHQHPRELLRAAQGRLVAEAGIRRLPVCRRHRHRLADPPANVDAERRRRRPRRPRRARTSRSRGTTARASRPRVAAPWPAGSPLWARNTTKLAGRVSVRVYRRAHGHWRMASPQRFVTLGGQGRFHTRLGKLGRGVLRPGTYRIRARYLGHRSAKPSASRYRKFKVRPR